MAVGTPATLLSERRDNNMRAGAERVYGCVRSECDKCIENMA